MVGYQNETRGDSQLSRFKKVATISHINGQKQALQRWLSGQDVQHVIVTRTFDDTNVTVAPSVRVSKKVAVDDSQEFSQGQPSQLHGTDLPSEIQAAPTTATGKLGQRRESSLLGIVQRVSIRRSQQQSLLTAQLHCPSQILPKAGFSMIKTAKSVSNSCRNAVFLQVPRFAFFLPFNRIFFNIIYLTRFTFYLIIYNMI